MGDYKCMSSKAKIEKADISVKREAIGGIVQGLSVCLADTYILLLKTHGYHWNVVGPQFVALHGFFEDIYTDLSEAADGLAERIRALGHPAPASFEQYRKLSDIEETTHPVAVDEMVENLLNDNENMAKRMQIVIRTAQEGMDEGTADLLIGRIRQHEKHAWMLRSLISSC